MQNNNSKIIIKKFTRPATIISLGLLFIIIFCAVLAPFLAPTNPYDLKVVSILDSRLSPGDSMFNGNVAWLGTDGAGRDVLSAIIYGLRTSLIVAICSALIGIVLSVMQEAVDSEMHNYLRRFWRSKSAYRPTQRRRC